MMKKILCSLFALMLLLSGRAANAQDSRARMDMWSTALHYVPTVADAALPLLGAKADRDYVDVLLTIGGAQVADIILTQTCKYAFKEVRPDGSDSHSFFSGHTSRAFVGAEVIRMEFGNGWGAGAYAVATTTGVLRVASGKHHWWDCAAGAGIGIACAHIGDCLQPTFRRWWNGIFGCSADIAFTPAVDPLSGVPCASVSICF